MSKTVTVLISSDFGTSAGGTRKCHQPVTRSSPNIQVGDLVRIGIPSSGMTTAYRYGTVVSTTHPMRDDPEWSDHRVIWHDGGDETVEWCEELEWCGSDDD